MEELIKQNYKSIVARGLISPSTTRHDFQNKLIEEVNELFESELLTDNFKEEIADVIMVCLNFAEHYHIDIIQEIKNKIKTNEKRATNTRNKHITSTF